ncbi:MAG: septum formation initiator family protein [Chloroflexota bacterium]
MRGLVLRCFRQVSPLQVVLLLVLTVALYFVTGFGGQIYQTRQIAQQTHDLEAQITQLQVQHDSLTQAVREAGTPAFVEQQARDQLGMIRPGDIPVVIVNAPKVAPAALPPAPAPAPTHWQQWAALLRPS